MGGEEKKVEKGHGGPCLCGCGCMPLVKNKKGERESRNLSPL